MSTLSDGQIKRIYAIKGFEEMRSMMNDKLKTREISDTAYGSKPSSNPNAIIREIFGEENPGSLGNIARQLTEFGILLNTIESYVSGRLYTDKGEKFDIIKHAHEGDGDFIPLYNSKDVRNKTTNIGDTKCLLISSLNEMHEAFTHNPEEFVEELDFLDKVFKVAGRQKGL